MIFLKQRKEGLGVLPSKLPAGTILDIGMNNQLPQMQLMRPLAGGEFAPVSVNFGPSKITERLQVKFRNEITLEQEKRPGAVGNNSIPRRRPCHSIKHPKSSRLRMFA